MAVSVECEIVLSISSKFVGNRNKDDLKESQRNRTKGFSLSNSLSMAFTESEKRKLKAVVGHL